MKTIFRSIAVLLFLFLATACGIPLVGGGSSSGEGLPPGEPPTGDSIGNVDPFVVEPVSVKPGTQIKTLMNLEPGS